MGRSARMTRTILPAAILAITAIGISKFAGEWIGIW